MPRRPLVIELVGPAGAGKSTLWQLLTARGGVAGASVWGLPRRLLGASAARTLYALGAIVRAARGVPWEEIQQLIRLDALDQVLDRTRHSGRTVVVVDEGPVFTFGWLRVLGHPCFRDDRLDAWWQRTLAHWAPRLDVLVVLDAADPLLTHRLRTRAKSHPFKDRSERDIVEFTAAYRREFDWVIGRLTTRGGPKVITLASDEAPPEELAERVLAACPETVHAQ